jgi:hypothetical protein
VYDRSRILDWVNALSNGRMVKQIVKDFIAGDEYKQRFIWGGVVQDIYMQVLERAPDASGGPASVAALEHGTTVRSLVAGAVASQEYASRYITSVSSRDAVTGLYHHVLARAPESDAVVDGWVQAAAANGWPSILPAFTGAEYVSRFGEWSVPGTGDAAFSAAVTHLYNAVLGRQPENDAVVVQWVAAAKAGGWDTVSNGFFESGEYDQRFTPLTVPGAGTTITFCP